MSTVLLIDAVGDACAAAEQALRAAGYEVVTSTEPADADREGVAAIVLAVKGADAADALDQVMPNRAEPDTPVVLATDFDHSGWDRTFGSAEALGVEALFDLPINAEALVERLDGILAARSQAEGPAASEMPEIMARAIGNEEAAAAFYRRAAEKVTDPETREVLQGLARDEQEHKRAIEEFQSGARSLPDEPPPAGSLVEKFGTPEFSPDMTPQDAFLLAARKEKLAVELYESWAELYPEGPERELLLKLADVERGHKARVEAMFANAAFPEAW
ncbi:MAG: ferritin family protein [Candidatus Brocadiia bacterium]